MSPITWLFEDWTWRCSFVSSAITLAFVWLGGFVGWVVL